MGEDYHVIRIKFNQFKNNVRMIINLPKKRWKWQQNNKHF